MEPTTSDGLAKAKKEAVNPQHINLRVVAPDGGEVYFKIKRNTQLTKLMSAYCDRQALSPNSVRFLFDGQRLKDQDTPDALNMLDNDIIDCVLQQTVSIFIFSQIH